MLFFLNTMLLTRNENNFPNFHKSPPLSYIKFRHSQTFNNELSQRNLLARYLQANASRALYRCEGSFFNVRQFVTIHISKHNYMSEQFCDNLVFRT